MIDFSRSLLLLTFIAIWENAVGFTRNKVFSVMVFLVFLCSWYNRTANRESISDTWTTGSIASVLPGESIAINSNRKENHYDCLFYYDDNALYPSISSLSI